VRCDLLGGRRTHNDLRAKGGAGVDLGKPPVEHIDVRVEFAA